MRFERPLSGITDSRGVGRIELGRNQPDLLYGEGRVANVQLAPPLINEEWRPLWAPYSFRYERGVNLQSGTAG